VRRSGRRSQGAEGVRRATKGTWGACQSAATERTARARTMPPRAGRGTGCARRSEPPTRGGPTAQKGGTGRPCGSSPWSAARSRLHGTDWRFRRAALGSPRKLASQNPGSGMPRKPAACCPGRGRAGWPHKILPAGTAQDARGLRGRAWPNVSTRSKTSQESRQGTCGARAAFPCA